MAFFSFSVFSSQRLESRGISGYEQFPAKILLHKPWGFQKTSKTILLAVNVVVLLEGKVYFECIQLVTRWCLRQSDWFAFNTTIELIMRSLKEHLGHRPGWVSPIYFQQPRMGSTTRRLGTLKQLWVYESVTSLDELHGKNLARVSGLHTLLVLNVLKMLEATSFEKINAVKKWPGMQNKQCNGICPFNSSDLFYRYSKKPNNQG